MLLTSASQAALFDHADIYLETLQPTDKSVAGAITAMTQDQQGFVWLGTQHGLVRFDGYHFQHFKPDPTNPVALHGHFIVGLAAAADGRLWIATRAEGVAVYDPVSGHFTNFTHRDDQPDSLGSNKVSGVFADKDGVIWFAHNGGLDYLDPGASAFKHVTITAAPNAAGSNTKGLSVTQTKDGTVWFGTLAGVRQGHAGADFGIPATLSKQLRARIDDKPVYRLLEAQDGALWFSIPTVGAIRYNPGSGEMIELSPEAAPSFRLQNKWVTAIAQVSSDEVWLATNGGGISIVDAKTGVVQRQLNIEHDVPGSLALDDVGSLMVDASGLVWVGTWGAGIQRYNPQNKAIRTLRFKPDNNQGLSHSHVLNVLQRRNGDIWFATHGNGVDVFNAEGVRTRTFQAHAGQEGALQEAAVQGLAETPDGQVWLGTLQSGLFRFLQTSQSFQHYGADEGLTSHQIRRLAAAQNNNLWIGTFTGLYQWQAQTDRVTPYYLDVAQTKEFKSNILAILPNPDGSAWIGSPDGLFLANASQQLVQRVDVTSELPVVQINDIQRDQQGRLLLSTPIALFRSQAAAATTFESMNTLLGIEAKDLGSNLLLDQQDRIWTATHLIDLPGLRVHEWSKADGIDFGVPWDGAHQTLQDGSFAIGGTKGVLLIRPEHYQSWQFKPPLVLTGYDVEGQSQWLQPGKVLQLSPGTKSTSLFFAALDYSQPDLNQYQYQLKGFDLGWRASDARQRAATYTNLDPGQYTLTIRGSNRAGYWQDQALSLQIIQLPAWYQTWLFKVVAMAGLLLVVFAGYRWRLRRLILSEQLLQQKVKSKTAQLELRNQELNDALEEVRQAALTDALTGLRNRRSLYEVLPADLAHSLRIMKEDPNRRDAQVLFFLLDIDFFKKINDEFGHQAGDLVLVQFADILRLCFREADLVARWGGEEFLVVCRDSNLDDRANLAERILTQVRNHRFKISEELALDCTCSVGVSCYPGAGVSMTDLNWEHLVVLADLALYEAKHQGRNTWRICSVPELSLAEQQHLISAPEKLIAAGVIQLTGPSA